MLFLYVQSPLSWRSAYYLLEYFWVGDGGGPCQSWPLTNNCLNAVDLDL